MMCVPWLCPSLHHQHLVLPGSLRNEHAPILACRHPVHTRTVYGKTRGTRITCIASGMEQRPSGRERVGLHCRAAKCNTRGLGSDERRSSSRPGEHTDAASSAQRWRRPEASPAVHNANDIRIVINSGQVSMPEAVPPLRSQNTTRPSLLASEPCRSRERKSDPPGPHQMPQVSFGSVSPQLCRKCGGSVAGGYPAPAISWGCRKPVRRSAVRDRLPADSHVLV